MIDDGDPAPDFDLPRPLTEGDQSYRLSAAAREGPVVVAFVRPDGPGTALLQSLANLDWARVAAQLSVFGIGIAPLDTVESLATDLDAPFPLLADPDGFFAERFGILTETPDGWRPHRALFVVDQSCRIRFAWSAEAGGDPPIDELTTVLSSL